MKSIIIYESTHHGNTEKLVDAVAAKFAIETVSIEKAKSLDLSAYDMIGLAAGIAFGKFYARIEQFAAKIPSGKRVFLLYTCGKQNDSYVKNITKTLKSGGVNVLGHYGCKGYDTYGPFKLIGGIAKGHPTDDEIDGAIAFYSKMSKEERS